MVSRLPPRLAGWGGTPDNGTLVIVLQNVGLGPALRVQVSASYVGHPGWQPTIAPTSTTIPAIPPNMDTRIELQVRFPSRTSREAFAAMAS